MKIQVLGTGCPNCKKTAQIIKDAAKNLGLNEGSDYSFEKVETMAEIMKFGILMMPGIVVDGKVISSGKVPSLAEATTIITNRLAQEG
jgi:small redox-active disulfide protein 2